MVVVKKIGLARLLRLVLGDDELSTWSVLLIRPHVSGDELNSSVLTPQETKDMSMLWFFFDDACRAMVVRDDTTGLLSPYPLRGRCRSNTKR